VAEKVLGATKWCVFRPMEPTRAIVEAAVAERMKRMQTNRVDLLQVSHIALVVPLCY
jgi:aryl-alcohol dehydrogenase-like predicted oxidoreductase